MDHYVGKLENNEALDFTSGKKHREESPVLDLSCKKQSSSCIMSPLSIESSPPLMDNPCDDNSHNDIINYGSTERKSPFEGRTFMVTPPSETDSPKKQKYEAMFSDVKVLTSMHSSDSMNLRYPMMSTSLPISPAILPIALGRPSDVQPLTSQLPVSSTSSSSSITLTPTKTHDATSSPMSPETGKKAPRPFKAYPKDPLSLSVGNGSELMYDQNSNEAYSEFRKRMLDSVRRTNEGTNIKMRRISKSPGLPTSTMDDKDSAYWERRRKNNEAAKRSRDARRAKEDEIAIRAAFLEQENMKLKYELVALRNETAKLRCMVYTN